MTAMRKLYFYLAGMLFTFAACSEDTPALPVSKGEETVKEIVEVLEEKEEISQFVEALKTVDVANLEEDELTVFAVRNQLVAQSRRGGV